MAKTNRFAAILAAVGILSAGLTSTQNTHAAGVVVTVTPSASAVSTAGTITLAFPALAVPAAGTIQVYRNTGYTGTAAFALSTGTVSATGTVSTSGTENSQTLTIGTATTAGTLTITVTGLTSPATAGNYAWKIFTSAGDYGANFQYVGQANVVQVRARVPLSLAFAIRDTTDLTNTNICDMGDLTTSAVGFCEYRLKVTTNAQAGYTINVVTTGNLTNGTANFINAAAGAAGTAQVVGTELYGAKVTAGTITGVGGTTTLATAYTGANDVAYVNTTATTLLTANKPNNPATTDTANTTLIRHEASISGSTSAGLYTQTVTYTIAPSF